MRIPLCAAVLSALAGTAQAQWTAVSLHPPGATSSAAFDVQNGRQVGWVVRQGEVQAATWQGTAASMFTIQPDGAPESFIFDLAGSQLVGRVFHENQHRASLWNSPDPASRVDLTPAGATYSSAMGIDGSRQIGEAMISSVLRAGFWNGTAASWTDLHPEWADWSTASDGDNGVQVGSAGVLLGLPRAMMWTGSPQSWINLHPENATQSRVHGVHAGRQVGEATINGHQHASVWEASAASWIDLSEASPYSIAWDTFNNVHVGHRRVDTQDRAWVWDRVLMQSIDLHRFLPSGFTDSYALGIWSDALGTYVVGSGHNLLTGRDEALMWTKPAASPPPPPPPPPPPVAGYLYNNWDYGAAPAPGSGFNPQALSASGASPPVGSFWRESPSDGALQPVFNGSAGWAMQAEDGYRIADDFTVPAGLSWTVEQFWLYSYQTGSTNTTPTITSATIRIWDGPPDQPTSQVVAGDTVTNRIVQAEWTSIYNIFASVSCSAQTPQTNRPIMRLKCGLPVTLGAGTYWIDYDAAGSASLSGPWAPAQVYSQTQRYRGGDNAMQLISGTWGTVFDTGQCGEPYPTPVDFSFEILGFVSECENPTDLTTTAIVGHPAFGVPDNRLSSDDFFYFLILYVEHQTCAGAACPNPPDMTATAMPGHPGYGVPDGVVNAQDFFYFVDLYAQGC